MPYGTIQADSVAKMLAVEKLLHTSEAAKALGISARSIARWAAEGKIVPDLVTPGGHLRWSIENLRQQLLELRERNTP